MSILIVALPVALLVVAAAIAAFVWAVRSGQYDDLETPAVRLLHDEDGPSKTADRRDDEDGAGQQQEVAGANEPPAAGNDGGTENAR